MKVKKFDNLWTMGLILCGAILVLFYIAKIFFPEFIVGVAETPSIVAFGCFVYTHKWAYHLFNAIYGVFVMYFYCGACCRFYKINAKSFSCIILANLLLRCVNEFLPQYYNAVNYTTLIAVPFLICLVNKKLCKETFISTTFCFIADVFCQILSLEIRNIALFATSLNTATFTIMLIDLVIWRILFYMFFNYKNKKEAQ